ncbi:hypothetical protein CRE_20882 [Caenorhabditis remanei]|uniref:Uncharacterized protein n=1 Tax=Caenorhabditis remanei TaxID=31234 RepID=E3MV37_CAERE|nr:hypothetical protein CRE_20882 [Caenorhabditis remanei]
MSKQQNICDSSKSPMPRTSALRGAQPTSIRLSPSPDNSLSPNSSRNVHVSRRSNRRNVPSTSNRLPSSSSESSESSEGSPEPKRRKIQKTTKTSSRRDVQSSSRRRRAPTPDYVLPAHYSAKGTHTPRSSTRRRVVPLYRVLSPLTDSSDESPQPMRRKNPNTPVSHLISLKTQPTINI